MKKQRLGVKLICLLVTALFTLFILNSYLVSATDEKIRIITNSEKEESLALANDCVLVREIKNVDFKAFECSNEIKSAEVTSNDAASRNAVSVNVESPLDLREDIKVHALDVEANKQIRADLVQSPNKIGSNGNTGKGRKIVVIDTGYNYLHPDLASSYLGGYDFVNDDNDPMDDNGHGSHVAGLITADGILDPKAKGVAPDAEIISAKVLGYNGIGYFSDFVAAIYWAVDGPDGVYGTEDDFNADAISMSMGSFAPLVYTGFCDDVYPPITEAIKYANSKGVSVVVAAGNDGSSGVTIPGCVSYSFTVGAVDNQDKIASFSGSGSSVDILAPGVGLYSTYLGNEYRYADGTSMATPIVSGVIALMKKKNPSASSFQIQKTLLESVVKFGSKRSRSTLGRVDAYAAVRRI